MSCSTEAFQGSISVERRGGPPNEAASPVYNIQRFQRVTTPSSVASTAGGAARPNHEDRLRGHKSLIDAVDTVLGTQSAPASGAADVNAPPTRDNGRTALQTVAEGGHLEVVEIDGNHPAKRNEELKNETSTNLVFRGKRKLTALSKMLPNEDRGTADFLEITSNSIIGQPDPADSEPVHTASQDRDTMLKLLPSDIQQFLSVFPTNSHWISHQDDESMLNRIKVWFEDKTQIKWDWWPMGSPRRLLQKGEARFFGECSCGEIFWQEMSSDHIHLVEKLLSLPENASHIRPLCAAGQKGLGWIAYFANAPGVTSNLYSSTVGATGSPAPAGPAIPPTAMGQAGAQGQGNIPTSSVTQQSPGIVHTPNRVPGQSRHWILLGLEPDATMKPAQINIEDTTTDAEFFEMFRKAYLESRGRFRVWFSLWQLQSYEVWKFHRFSLTTMGPEGPDFPPDDRGYWYNPTGPTARNPPIRPDLFKAMFSCRRGVFCKIGLRHHCILVSTSTHFLQPIPKRTQQFKGDRTPDIWGLGTVHAPSLFFALLYQFLLIMIGIVFYALWLINKPEDQSNASVPLMIILAAEAAFWGTVAVLGFN